MPFDTGRRLEPLAKKHYHACLIARGVKDYSFENLERDWKLACMHFPFYVAMWFGTTPDENLVDADFPRRFVPRAFDAILRNGAHLLLMPAAVDEPESPDLPKSLEALTDELKKTKLELAHMTSRNGELTSALNAIRTAIPSNL